MAKGEGLREKLVAGLTWICLYYKRAVKNRRNNMRIKISAFTRSLFFSFVSYTFVLFVILVIDTFSYKDFIFARAAAISAVYLGALVVLFMFMVVVFKVKRKAA